jgi:hypothetical protein
VTRACTAPPRADRRPTTSNVDAIDDDELGLGDSGDQSAGRTASLNEILVRPTAQAL